MEALASCRQRFGADGWVALEHDFICAICYGSSGRSSQERAARTVRTSASGVISFARFRGRDGFAMNGRVSLRPAISDGRTGEGPICYGRAGVSSADHSWWTDGLRSNAISFARFAMERTAVSSAAISDGRTGGGVTRFHLRDLKAPGDGGRICYGRHWRLVGSDLGRTDGSRLNTISFARFAMDGAGAHLRNGRRGRFEHRLRE